jgi:hypothetical protein
MDEKIENVVRCLSGDFSVNTSRVNENLFEIETKLSVHKAYLKLEVSGDILRAELQYLFGVLDVHVGMGDVLRMLMENVGSFGYTSSFLGLKHIDDTMFTVLSGYYLFHMKWDEKDIADVLNLALSDIYMNFISWQWPDAIHVLGNG